MSKEYIKNINILSESQDTYGIRMGTNSQIGTYVYKMRNELNYHQNYHRYSYTQKNPGMSNMFKEMIRSNIFYGNDTVVKGKPVILHARTGSLFKYNKVNIGHYLTVNGYNRFNHNIEYVDTWNANYGHGYTGGQNRDNFNAVFNTVANYRYVIS